MSSMFAIPQLLTRAHCNRRSNRLTRTIVYLTVLAHARVGEIVALMWDDVDFGRSVIRLRSKDSTRVVRLNPELARALAEWREHLLEVEAARGAGRISPFVLGSRLTGEPVSPRLVRAILMAEARHVRLSPSGHAIRRANAERLLRRQARKGRRANRG